MYQTRPDDYDAFRCIAGACPQTCCAAWEIVVDPDAQDAYLRLRHPLAQKLRRVMRVDADGDTYFAQTDGRCPFLCADGLCELQRTLGAQSLCRTCRDFPRWEVLLCDRVEQGLSLACPEAARQLLARTAPLRLESVRIPDDGYVPGARERAEAGEILFGTVDTWLVWKLTGGKVHVTDRTNASRTMLYNIRTLDWDDTLLKALDIPRCILPRVADSSEVYGTTDLCGVQVPVAGIAGDQQAALFGQGCFAKGEAKNTYGTGCFLLMNTGDTICRSQNGLISTIGISLNGKVEYALEGSVFVGGAVIQWVRDGLRMIQESRDAEYYAQKVPDNGGVYLVPAFTGLGAPNWDMHARGCIVGITRGTRREHIIRAAQESIAYQVADLVKAMEADTGLTLSALKADGGASRDRFLMQFQADIIGCQVRRPVIRETTALGSAYLAGLAVGIWKNRDELRSLWNCEIEYDPAMEPAQKEKLLHQWHRAVQRSLAWEEE